MIGGLSWIDSNFLAVGEGEVDDKDPIYTCTVPVKNKRSMT